MSFLQPGLLWWLAPFLLAPLLVHLLSRRLTRPLEFPTVRHLKVSLTRSAAIYRWRHWLFLLLRTLLLAMLLLAFLLPILQREGSLKSEQSRSVFLVIDNSLSMEHVSGGQTARQRAIHEAERILDTLRPGDRVNILRVHHDASPAFPVPSESLGRARDFRSPFLKIFSGTRLQDLGKLEVYDNYSAAFTGSGKKLLNFADGSPAMTEQTHGIGQLLLINFSPNTQYSNLAKLRFFPVWIQSLVHAFGSDSIQALYHTVGQRVVTKLWKNEISHSQFTNPDGKPIDTKVEVIGQRASVSFPTTRLGIYQLTIGDELIAAFAVNPPPQETDLRPIPREDLPERQGTPEQSVLLDGTTTDFNKAVFGHPLFPWFIGAALLVALAELGLHQIVHRQRPNVSR